MSNQIHNEQVKLLVTTSNNIALAPVTSGEPICDVESLPRRDRLRRVVLLCCSFIQNLAFYRAAMANQTAPIRSDFHTEATFLRRAINNFIDIAVLDWCKLFGSHKGEKHHWRRVVSDPASFELALLSELGISADALARLVERMLSYRDKFVAHLDNHLVMDVPELEEAHKALSFYHRHIVEHEANPDDELAGLPSASADALACGFAQSFDEAMRAYRKLAGVSVIES